jgi:hypothetical protein
MKNIIYILFFLTGSIFSQSQISISDVVNTANQISKTGKASKDKLDKIWFSTAELELIVSSDVEYNYGSLDNNGNLISRKFQLLQFKCFKIL